MSFSKQVGQWAIKANKANSAAVRKVCLDLVTELDRTTPRDTGRLANNWQASLDAPKTGELDRTSGALAENTASVTLAPGRVWFICNPLPYSAVAEFGLWGTGSGATERTTRDGYSVQAPYGFARLAYKRALLLLK